MQVKSQWDPERDAHVIVSTSMRSNPVYLTYYVVWSKLIVTEVLPYLTIIALNVVIIFKARKASSFRNQVGFV